MVYQQLPLPTKPTRLQWIWRFAKQDYFDLSNLQQQFVYQMARGAEGNSTYFEMAEDKGSTFAGYTYAAKVFYKLLAPELLTDLMGDLGEKDERGIEDTIHEKVGGLIRAKRTSATMQEQLERTERTLGEIEGALTQAGALVGAQRVHKGHAEAFATEIAAVKHVLIDKPIPGIPSIPPEHLPIARSMVMQGRDGIWYLPDRVMAEFTSEEPKVVNQRARDRSGINITPAILSQVIDFNCDLKTRDPRGKPNQLYTRESALALLKVTTNFTKDWAREKAIAAVTEAFVWVEANWAFFIGSRYSNSFHNDIFQL